jgi:DUF4097 and DUF4098 domain-containing protein YvlB
MTWLYSILFAGLMFSTDASVPAPTVTNYAEPQTLTVVKLDETERFEQTYPLSANGRVAVSNVNGSIAIDTWDKNEVKFTAVKTAETKELLAEVEIRIDSKPDYFSVETDYGDWKRTGKGWKNRGRLEIEYTLTVPRGASLNEIETVNGSVKIVNAGGSVVRASAVNGEVRASNLRGAASLSSVNGLIEADFDNLQTGTRINLDTVNGTVNLTIPSDANATFRADSVNGNIANDFGLPVRKGKYVGRDLYGKVGSGDVQIRLNSVNGGLSIKRKNDGRNVNPAVNLLPQKSEDDEDWDDDDDNDSDDDSSRAARAKMNKDIAKATKEVTKEVKKIEPQIAKATADAVKLSTESITEATKALESEDFKKQVQDAVKAQQETWAKMAEVGWTYGAPIIEKKSDSFVVKGTPKVTVDAKNCDVVVRGWDKNEVKYSVTKISKVRGKEPLQAKAVNTDSDVNITVTNPDAAAYKDLFNKDISRVAVEVYVPKKSNLKIITNREIRLEGVSGELDINGSEGAVNVRDSDGKLLVSSDCAKIRVIGFRGEVSVTTNSGSVSLEGDFAKISGTTREGNFVLTLPETVNADVVADTEAITVENFPAPTELSEGKWRFGKGGAKYNFTVGDGQIFVRSASVLKAE